LLRPISVQELNVLAFDVAETSECVYEDGEIFTFLVGVPGVPKNTNFLEHARNGFLLSR
jgi:hypothetical protein